MRVKPPDFQSIFQSVPGLYLILEPDFTIVAASDAYLSATMTRREKIVGRPIFEVFPENPSDPHSNGPANLSASLGRVLQNRGSDGMALQKYDILRPQEIGGGFEERYWKPFNSPVIGEDGSVTYIVHQVEDVTEMVRLKQTAADQEKLRARAAELEQAVKQRTAELRESVRELEAFCYSLSHDMRAPIRAILSFSEVVLRDCQEKIDPGSADLLDRVIKSAHRLDRLIQEVLAYTNLSRRQVTMASVNAERLIHDIIRERSEFQPPAVEITVQSSLPLLLTHEISLTQCITNLLDNAVKYVAPGVKPQIRIYSEPAGEHVRLCFQDNGIGIDKSGQQRLFELFQRVHGNDQYPGIGIGLAIVRKAVARMGGQAGVDSEPGKGSRFWLQLPPASK